MARFFSFLLLAAALLTTKNAFAETQDSSAECRIELSHMKYKMDGDNGRDYYLVNSVVIEAIEAPGLPFKYNLFDFDNGILVSVFQVEGGGCKNYVTPMSQLPEGRASEVQAIGCKIFDQEKRLIQRDDELDYYRRKFCSGNTP